MQRDWKLERNTVTVISYTSIEAMFSLNDIISRNIKHENLGGKTMAVEKNQKLATTKFDEHMFGSEIQK